MDLRGYWAAVAAQDAEALRPFFRPDAAVEWPCTGERFSAEEFIRANCAYPGRWEAEIERVIPADECVVTIVRVFSPESGQSLHATSLFTLRKGQIAALTEYFADDCPAPEWRKELLAGE